MPALFTKPTTVHPSRQESHPLVLTDVTGSTPRQEQPHRPGRYLTSSKVHPSTVDPIRTHHSSRNAVHPSMAEEQDLVVTDVTNDTPRRSPAHNPDRHHSLAAVHPTNSPDPRTYPLGTPRQESPLRTPETRHAWAEAPVSAQTNRPVPRSRQEDRSPDTLFVLSPVRSASPIRPAVQDNAAAEDIQSDPGIKPKRLFADTLRPDRITSRQRVEDARQLLREKAEARLPELKQELIKLRERISTDLRNIATIQAEFRSKSPQEKEVYRTVHKVQKRAYYDALNTTLRKCLPKATSILKETEKAPSMKDRTELRFTKQQFDQATEFFKEGDGQFQTQNKSKLWQAASILETGIVQLKNALPS